MEVQPNSLVEMRRRASRFAGRSLAIARRIRGLGPDVSDPISHRIEVDLSTGVRSIERNVSVEQVVEEVVSAAQEQVDKVFELPIVAAPALPPSSSVYWQTPEGKNELARAERVKLNVEAVRVGYIQQVVASFSNCTAADLVGPCRQKKFAHPRHVAILLTKQLRPDLSLPKIGYLFGNRDHTTVMHALRVTPPRIEAGQSSKRWYDAALAEIRIHFPEPVEAPEEANELQTGEVK